MEPLFVNQYIRNEEADRELYRYISFQSPRAICSYLLAGIPLLLSLLYLIPDPLYHNDPVRHNDPAILYIALAFLGLVLLSWIINTSSYFYCVRISRKRLLEASNDSGEIPTVVTITDTELIHHNESNSNEIELPVTKFKQLITTKHYYMIMTESKIFYCFRKDCFVTGKEEEFVPYINQLIRNNNLNRK